MPWLEEQVHKNLNRYRVACLMLDCKYTDTGFMMNVLKLVFVKETISEYSLKWITSSCRCKRSLFEIRGGLTRNLKGSVWCVVPEVERNLKIDPKYCCVGF